MGLRPTQAYEDAPTYGEHPANRGCVFKGVPYGSGRATKEDENRRDLS